MIGEKHELKVEGDSKEKGVVSGPVKMLADRWKEVNTPSLLVHVSNCYYYYDYDNNNDDNYDDSDGNNTDDDYMHTYTHLHTPLYVHCTHPSAQCKLMVAVFFWPGSDSICNRCTVRL